MAVCVCVCMYVGKDVCMYVCVYLPLDPLFVKGEGADCLAREADVVEFLHDGCHGY